MSEQNTNVNHDGGDNDNGNGGGEKWYSNYSEDLHEHVKDYDSAEAMVKSHVELKGKVPVVPEKPEGYNYEHPKDGPKITNQEQFDNFINGIKNAAHQLGLTQSQFEAAVNGEISRVNNRVKAAQEVFQKSVKALKDEWGDKFDENTKRVDRVAEVFMSNEDFDSLKKNGSLGYAQIVKLLLSVSSKMSEDVFEKGGDHQDNKNEPELNPLTGRPKLKYNNTKYE